MPVAKTLEEFLEMHPETELPCICDLSEVIAYGHSMSCPKSKYYPIYHLHSDGHLLDVLQGPPRPCSTGETCT